ncbi:glycosyltransferase family 2 protein [Komagataeibacter diospyri]|uniref:Fucolectin tachylectin-4 pentraxin-1 n=1 Tax=Komagataeibacter diospyri TaxID=1932662 RepID=A0A4P5NLK0_9PROT|nr:glycosyltransferase family 2 protein [Komagataeibacter diospyri]GCE82243.1 fucolectin tachylectin-4 pentraxin-1 [Komagataeibacter diospyri]
MVKYNFSVAVCARWEKSYILEWLTYYKSIGYDHVYLYCNDDNPDELYREILPFVVGNNKFVTFIHFKGQGLQQQMYLHFLSNYHQETEWVSFLDVDEFLDIPAFKNISDLVHHYPEADCIVFYWIVFGHNGYEKSPSGSVLENYKKRARQINQFTKYICKTEYLLDDKIFSPAGFGFWHNPAGHSYKEIRVVDVLHRTNFDPNTLSPKEIHAIQKTATVHHYMIKSREYLKHRINRGTGGAFSGQVIWDETEASKKNALERSMHEFNEEEDVSLCAYWDNLIRKSSEITVPPIVNGNIISSNRPCNQSSVSDWSIGNDPRTDAGNAVNGNVNGTVKFHTDLENNPWWQIDLIDKYFINDIVIYNIIDATSERCKNIRILYSDNGKDFHVAFEKMDNIPVGSLITTPLHISTSFFARYIRIILMERNFLHLDQVEIYGSIVHEQM